MKTALVLATLGTLVAAEAAAQQAGDRIGWNSGNRSGDPAVVERIAALIVESNPDPAVRAVGRSGVSQSGAAMTVDDVLAALGGTATAIGRSAAPAPEAPTVIPAAAPPAPSAPSGGMPAWFTRQSRNDDSGGGGNDSSGGGGGGNDSGGGGGGNDSGGGGGGGNDGGGGGNDGGGNDGGGGGNDGGGNDGGGDTGGWG